MPGYCSKTMGFFAPAELSAPDPRQVLLKKRLSEEMEALRGILRKAELVVRRNADKGGAAPRRRKDGHLSAEEARSEAMEAKPITCAKRRKSTPPVENIEPPPRISKADQVPCAKERRTTPPVEIIEAPCAKKRRTTPPVEIIEAPCAKKRRTALPVEIIEARISKDEIFSLGTRLSSLSSNMPACILEFLNKECTGHIDEKAGEIEIDLGSMTRSAMLDLQKLLDEFAEEDKRRQQKEESMNACRSTSRSTPRELEEGEFIEEDCGATMDTCGGHASPVVARKGLCSPPQILEDGEMTEEEEVDICGDVDPIAIEKFIETAKSSIAIEKFVEAAKSPSSSSTSSLSRSSSSSGSSSSGSSCSCSDSSCSCSDSSDSDSSDSGSDDECVTSNPVPDVLRKTDASPMAMPHKVLSPIAEEESLLEDGEIQEEQESSAASPVAAEKFAETVNNTGSANGQCVRSSLAPAVRPEPSKPQPAAQGTARHFYAKGIEKKHERAAAAQGTVRRFYAKAFEKMSERQRAYEKLEEMERNTKPIFDWIHPTHLRQLGISREVEYAVTCERRLPARRGCPVQSLLGLFLKAE